MQQIIEKELNTHLDDFRFFSESELKKLQSISRIKKHQRGQVLFDFGDDRAYVYVLLSGIVKLERMDDTASYSYLHFIKGKRMFPIVGLFSDDTYYFSASAYTDIEVIMIPTLIYEECLQRNNQQLRVCLMQQSKFLKEQVFKIQKGLANQAESRVLTTLSIIYKELGEKCYPSKIVTTPCPICVNDIARASGITRETASLILKKLINAKTITYQHKKLTFIDTVYMNNFLTC